MSFPTAPSVPFVLATLAKLSTRHASNGRVVAAVFFAGKLLRALESSDGSEDPSALALASSNGSLVLDASRLPLASSSSDVSGAALPHFCADLSDGSEAEDPSGSALASSNGSPALDASAIPLASSSADVSSAAVATLYADLHAFERSVRPRALELVGGRAPASSPAEDIEEVVVPFLAALAHRRRSDPNAKVIVPFTIRVMRLAHLRGLEFDAELSKLYEMLLDVVRLVEGGRGVKAQGWG